MTPALTKLIAHLTCSTCLGNGMLNSREVASFDANGRPLSHRNLPRVCEKCLGSGVNLSPSFPPHP